MKGRLLTREEIKNLQKSDKKYVLQNTASEIIVTVGETEYIDKDNKRIADIKCVGLMVGDFKLYEYIEEPKSYKTSEMIAMLEENPKLRFKQKDWTISYLTVEDSKLTIFTDKKESKLSRQDSDRYLGTYFNLDELWTLIQEPKEVTFLEALNIYKDGKDIYFDIGNGKFKVDHKTVNLFSLNEIARAKWYVED